MHTISETAVYLAICAALPVILLIGEIKAERERRRRAEADRDLWRKQFMQMGGEDDDRDIREGDDK